MPRGGCQCARGGLAYDSFGQLPGVSHRL